MAYRVKVSVVKGDEVLYTDQVLGNNEDFKFHLLKERGIVDTECHDGYTFTTTAQGFLDLFVANHIECISSWNDSDWEGVISSLKDPKSQSNTIPSWTVLGNFSIIVNEISQFTFDPEVSVIITSG